MVEIDMGLKLIPIINSQIIIYILIKHNIYLWQIAESCTINDSMVKSNRNWQKKPRCKFSSIPFSLLSRSTYPRIPTSGELTIGIIPVDPIPPKLLMVKVAPSKSSILTPNSLANFLASGDALKLLRLVFIVLSIVLVVRVVSNKFNDFFQLQSPLHGLYL